MLYGGVERAGTELRIDVSSHTVVNTDTAKTVEETARGLALDFESGELTHSFDVVVGQEMHNHLQFYLLKAYIDSRWRQRTV